MKIERISLGYYQTNCYLLHLGEVAWVIDPADSPEVILERVKNLEGVILTHFHYDHLLALPELIKEHPETKIYIHPLDAPFLGPEGGAKLGQFARSLDPSLRSKSDLFWRSLPSPTHLIDEGDIIEGIELRVIHTPGHSLGSICLYREGILFAGDTLFARSIGRSDLPHSAPELLISSIESKLLTLPKETIVYPGHGPETTIGDEQRLNPYL